MKNIISQKINNFCKKCQVNTIALSSYSKNWSWNCQDSQWNVSNSPENRQKNIELWIVPTDTCNLQLRFKTNMLHSCYIFCKTKIYERDFQIWYNTIKHQHLWQRDFIQCCKLRIAENSNLFKFRFAREPEHHNSNYLKTQCTKIANSRTIETCSNQIPLHSSSLAPLQPLFDKNNMI